MKITIDEVTRGVEFTPSPAGTPEPTEFEVAKDAVVRLRRPTIKARKEFYPVYLAKAKEQEAFRSKHQTEPKGGGDPEWDSPESMLQFREMIDDHAAELAKLAADGTFPDAEAVEPKVAWEMVNAFLALLT